MGFQSITPTERISFQILGDYEHCEECQTAIEAKLGSQATARENVENGGKGRDWRRSMSMHYEILGERLLEMKRAFR